MFTEQHVSPEAQHAFESERTAAVAGLQLMKQFNWEVGQTVTLVGQMHPVTLKFKIVGTYESDIAGQDNVFYFRGDYLNEALDNPNTVGFFWIKADDGSNVPGVIEYVDTMFHNSPAETKTETEKSFVLGFFAMMGNIRVLIGSIAIVVMFTMLLVAASTMAMTVRERLREVAILKSIGYPRRMVLGLILGEAVFIAFLGGVTGCLFAYFLGFGNLPKWTGGFVPVLPVSVPTLGLAILTGVAIGLVSAFLPALQASRMTITEALRRLD
jgi:putative ABC transport system permease protein